MGDIRLYKCYFSSYIFIISNDLIENFKQDLEELEENVKSEPEEELLLRETLTANHPCEVNGE